MRIRRLRPEEWETLRALPRRLWPSARSAPTEHGGVTYEPDIRAGTTRPALRRRDALLEDYGGPMASLEFTDPTTGRPVMPTMACEMHRVLPGRRTTASRKVGSSVLVVHRGSGASVINGTRLEWGPGDMLAVPSWAAVDHEATEPSDLFAITDAPVLKALGLYREATLEQPQEITGSFPG